AQLIVVLVMDGELGLRGSPLEPTARAFLDFGRQIRPAGESVLTRDDELRIAVRERERRSRQLCANTSEGFAVSGGGVACEFLRLLAKGGERRACGQISSSGH